MDTIVVGVADTPQCRDALGFAKRLATGTGAEVHAVSVDPTIVYYLGEGDMAESRERFFARTRAVAESVLGPDAPFRTLVERSAASGLTEVADELDADLVVAGSSHRGPIGRVLAGDVGNQLIAGSSRPVSIVPRGGGVGETAEMRSIGVGFDGSAESRIALEHALEIARKMGAEIELIGVLHYLMYAGPFAPVSPGVRETVMDKMKGLLEETRAEIDDVEARYRILEGEPADQLTRASDDLGLLVLGSRAYGPLRRAFLGSTSMRVVRSAACPVTIVPRG